MNKLHAIWMLCASLALPSVLTATPTITSLDINGSTVPFLTNRTINATTVVNPAKVTGAGSLITKVELYMDGVLKSTVTVPTSVVLNPGPPATPKTYTFKHKLVGVNAGNHTFKTVAYENSVPVSSSNASLNIDIADDAPQVTEITCSPNAIKYVANPAVSISTSLKVSDDAKVTKVEFYWVPNSTGVEPGTLKGTVNVNAVSGVATYLYTGINVSGEMRFLVYDELGNQPNEQRKPITVEANAAPNCGPVLTEPVFLTTFTSPIVKNGVTPVTTFPATLFNPGAITIQIAAFDETGTVTKMELFNKNVLFATSTTVAPIPDPNFAKPPYFLFTFTFPALAAGTYELSWKATDSYGAFCTQLTPFVLTVDKCADLNEPANNTKAGAVSIGATSTTYSKLASAADVADYYTIKPAPGSYIYLTGTDATGAPTTTLPADFDMALYASSGKSTLPIAVSEEDGTTTEVIDLSALPVAQQPDGIKTYTLKVYGYNGASSASCYRLRATMANPTDRIRRKTSTKNTAIASETEMTMELTPNPAINEVTLMTSVDNAGEYNLAVTDVLGREVKRQTLTLNEGSNSTPIDISNIGKGMYIVRLWNGQGQLTQKLNIEK